ncbi:MAG: hypothetical protein QG622_350 [Actinomycetota bacterium]|nr:hypothetical protein [Actinomycetota bacterium]
MGAGDGRRTVAIWGSCVTRDAFAVESRAEELAERLPLLYYGARSSWISQDSRPLPVTGADMNGLTGFGLRMVEEDLARTVIDRLVEHQPDLLVLDLVDERLQLLRLGRSWVTGSDYVKRTEMWTKALAEADEVSSMTQPRRQKLFATSARHLVKRLVKELPDTTFVLNEAPYTTRVADGTELPEPQAGWARDLEAAQRPMTQVLVAEFGPRLVRATPPAEVAQADPNHRWGITSYHYVEAYYHWLIDLLLTVEPTTSAPARNGRRIIDLRPFDVRRPSLRSLLRR